MISDFDIFFFFFKIMVITKASRKKTERKKEIALVWREDTSINNK